MRRCGIARESGYSRLPVYVGDLDTIDGVVYARDLYEDTLRSNRRECGHRAPGPLGVARHQVSILSPRRSEGRLGKLARPGGRRAVSILSPRRSEGRRTIRPMNAAALMFQSSPLAVARGDSAALITLTEVNTPLAITCRSILENQFST